MGSFPFDRRCRARWAIHGLCLALLGIAASTAAQAPTLKTRTKEQRDREYLAAHRITLNVQVVDSAGKSVTDLSPSDFAVLDNDQARKIVGFHVIDGELMSDATEVVLVLDAVNSSAPQLQQERQTIFNYLAHGHGPLSYPTSFALWFNGHLKAASATTDRNALGRAFVGITKNVHSNACSAIDGAVEKTSEGGAPSSLQEGRTPQLVNCLEVHSKDSIAALDGIAQQQKTIGGRTILIWVGPGWPLMSEVEFSNLAPKAQDRFHDGIVDLLHDLRDSQLTVDVVAPQDGTPQKETDRIEPSALIAASSPRNITPADLSLPLLASRTGGRALTASRDMDADLSSCIHDADNYYAMSFEAMPAASPHEFHKLEVKVKRPGVSVRTLMTYYAEP